MSRLQEKTTNDIEVKPFSKTGIILAIIIILNLLLCGYLLFTIINLQHQINILTISSEQGIEAIDKITMIMADISQMQVKVDSQFEILEGLYKFTEQVADQVDKLALEIQEIKEVSRSKGKGGDTEWKNMFNKLKDNMNNMYRKAQEFGQQSAEAHIKGMKEKLKEKKDKLKEKSDKFMKKTQKMWEESKKRWGSMFDNWEL